MEYTEEFVRDTLSKVKTILDSPARKLNKELLLRVADRIENQPKECSIRLPIKYNQSVWFDPNYEDRNLCGSAGCLAGEIALEKFTPKELSILGNNSKIDGITSFQLYRIFEEFGFEYNPSFAFPVTSDDAALIREIAKALSGVNQEFASRIFDRGGYSSWVDDLRELTDAGKQNEAAAELLRRLVHGGELYRRCEW